MPQFNIIHVIFLRYFRSFIMKHDKSDLLSKWIFKKLIEKKDYKLKRTDL